MSSYMLPANFGASGGDVRILAADSEKRRRQLEQRRPDDFIDPYYEQTLHMVEMRISLADDLLQRLDSRSSGGPPEAVAEIRSYLEGQKRQAENIKEVLERDYTEWQEQALINYYETGEEPKPIGGGGYVGRPEDEGWF